MPVLSRKVGAAVGLVAAAAALFSVASPASADTGARSTDIVGVGSDTAQNFVDFVLGGAPGVAGGYNSQGNNHRVFSDFATGDANGRSTYDGGCGTKSLSLGLANLCSSTNAGAPEVEPASIVLRDGTAPVTRPNGSGAGITALVKDGVSAGSGTTPVTGYQTLPGGSIQFARASRPPKNATGEEPTCDGQAACGGLHTYRIATDGFGIAAETTGSNAPAGLSIADLQAIYGCTGTGPNGAVLWNALPGNSAGPATPIHALIPQSGSGTRTFFSSVIGNTNDTYGSCVRVVQEHDPTGIYLDPSPADAIEPFSQGKLSLINNGYFQNSGVSGTSFAQGAYTPNFLHLLSGSATAADGGTAAGYTDTNRPIFIVLRQVDVTATVGSVSPYGVDSVGGATYPAFQPGGTQTWAQALFTSSGSYFAKSAQSALFTAAGVTQAWKDCGLDMTTNNNPNNC